MMKIKRQFDKYDIGWIPQSDINFAMRGRILSEISSKIMFPGDDLRVWFYLNAIFFVDLIEIDQHFDFSQS